MSEVLPSSAGRLGTVRLRSLKLDPLNPRIPESVRGDDNENLAVLLEMGFNAYSVAQSIADLGYFSAEPLIVVPDVRRDNNWIVVEGNRRLTALLGLADSDVRNAFTEPDRWNALASRRSITLDMLIPVVMHDSRETTHAEVARVHVVGKLAWRPFMQAKYIAARVDEGRSLQEVADLIGITKAKAADLYRDQAVLDQATKLGLNTEQVENAFSLLTVAMSSTKIREHIGAPLGSRLEVGVDPIPDDRHGELSEVLNWIFGSEESEALISDSRQISQLGNAIASEVGLRSLRAGETLEEAKQKIAAAGLAPLTRLIKRLTAARNALESATDDLAEFALEVEVRGLLSDIESIVQTMTSTWQEVEESERG